MSKRMSAQMKIHTFSSFHLIFIIEVLEILKLAGGTIEVRKSAVMWLSHFFVNKNASVVLNAHLSAEYFDETHS